MDPSQPVPATKTSKIVIDATLQLPGEGGPASFPRTNRELLTTLAPDAFARVDAKWSELIAARSYSLVCSTGVSGEFPGRLSRRRAEGWPGSSPLTPVTAALRIGQRQDPSPALSASSRQAAKGPVSARSSAHAATGAERPSTHLNSFARHRSSMPATSE